MVTRHRSIFVYKIPTTSGGRSDIVTFVPSGQDATITATDLDVKPRPSSCCLIVDR